MNDTETTAVTVSSDPRRLDVGVVHGFLTQSYCKSKP